MTVGLVQAGRPTRIAKHEGADAREIYMLWRRRRPNARKYVFFGAEGAETLRNMYVLAPKAPKRSKICMVWRRRRRSAQKYVRFGAEGAKTLENMYGLAPKAPKRSEMCMVWRRRRPNARKYICFGAEGAQALENMQVCHGSFAVAVFSAKKRRSAFPLPPARARGEKTHFSFENRAFSARAGRGGAGRGAARRGARGGAGRDGA